MRHCVDCAFGVLSRQPSFQDVSEFFADFIAWTAIVLGRQLANVVMRSAVCTFDSSNRFSEILETVSSFAGGRHAQVCWCSHLILLLTPPPALDFSDQYAFRPTGSTTAALIYILQSVTDLLADNPYVSVIALDFSKAFDTVRH